MLLCKTCNHVILYLDLIDSSGEVCCKDDDRDVVQNPVVQRSLEPENSDSAVVVWEAEMEERMD